MFEDEEEELPVTEEFAPGDEASAQPIEEAPWNEVAKRRQAAGGGMWSQAASGLGNLADKVGGFLAPPADASDSESLPIGEDPGALATGDDNPLTRGANAILKAVNSALMYGRQISGIGGQPVGNAAEPELPPTVNPISEKQAAGGPGRQAERPASTPRAQPRGTPEWQERRGEGVPARRDTSPSILQGMGDAVAGVAQGAAQRMGQDPAIRGVKSILSYLQGEGAAPPEQVKQWEQKADPTGTMGESMKKALAVATAAAAGGPAAAHSVLQAYRIVYDHQRAIAAAAAQRGDPVRAAEAFTAAMANVPDGNTVQVQPGQGGYTATVTPPSGGPRVINLTRENFDAFVRGPQGQYDAVLAANGNPTYLTGGAGRMSRAIEGDFSPEPGDEYVPSTRPGVALEGHPSKMQEAPRISPFMTPIKTLTPSVPARGRQGPQPFTDDEEAAAKRVFPMSSEDSQRGQYLATQRKDRLAQTNQREIAEGKNATSLQNTQMRTDAVRDRTHALRDRTEQQEATKLIVGEARTGAYDRRSLLNNEAALAKVASNEQIAGWRSANSQLATTMRALGTKISNGVPMTPQEVQAWSRGIEQLFNTGGQPQQQAPAQGAPQQRAPAQAPQGAPQQQRRAPQAGDTVDGFRFRGGDPNKRENWVRAGAQ